MFDNVVGSKKIREKLIKNKYKVDSILPVWNKDIQRFNYTKERYHLYR